MNVTLPEGHEVISLRLQDGTELIFNRHYGCNTINAEGVNIYDIFKYRYRAFLYFSEDILWEADEFTVRRLKLHLEGQGVIVGYNLKAKKENPVGQREIVLSSI